MGVCYKKENSILYTSIVHISPVSPFISLFSHSLFYMYSFEEIKRFSDIFFLNEGKQRKNLISNSWTINLSCLFSIFYFPDEYDCFYFI